MSGFLVTVTRSLLEDLSSSLAKTRNYLSLIKNYSEFEYFSTFYPGMEQLIFSNSISEKLLKPQVQSDYDSSSFEWALTPLWRMCFQNPGYAKEVKYQFLIMQWISEYVFNVTTQARNSSTLHSEWCLHISWMSSFSQLRWDYPYYNNMVLSTFSTQIL